MKIAAFVSISGKAGECFQPLALIWDQIDPADGGKDEAKRSKYLKERIQKRL